MSTDYRPGARRRSRSRRPQQQSQASPQKKKNPIAKFFSKLFGGQDSGNGHARPSQSQRGEHRGGGRRRGGDKRKSSYRTSHPSEPGISKSSSASSLLEITSNRLYLGNLSYDVAESDLFDLLSQVAPVRNVEVARERRSSRSKGFGFVEMESVEGAKAVQAKFHGYELMGRALVISGAKSRSESAPSEPIVEA